MPKIDNLRHRFFAILKLGNQGLRGMLKYSSLKFAVPLKAA
jgi:hypothetical protein